jgi:hypothetical protein
MPPRRVKRAEDDAALRTLLLAEARGLYDTCPCDELAKPVEALAAGREVIVHRDDLPDDHPLRWAGGNCDALVLGADDVVRPYEPAQ